MHHNSKVILLSLVFLALLAILFLSMSRIEKNQNIQSRASKLRECTSNVDCPKSSVCVEGKCVLEVATVTQSPLSYAKVSDIDQEAKPIPSYFVEPTPTPEPNMLYKIAYGVNSFFGGIFNTLFNLVDSAFQGIVK